MLETGLERTWFRIRVDSRMVSLVSPHTAATQVTPTYVTRAHRSNHSLIVHEKLSSVFEIEWNSRSTSLCMNYSKPFHRCGVHDQKVVTSIRQRNALP